MINNVVLVGRMTRDAELRYTPSNVAVATFSLAVNRNFKGANGERETDFINCVIWRQQAENLANWAKKGALIGITGRIQTRNYENQQGQRVYVTEVVADNFQMLESRAAREGHSGGSYNAGGFDNSSSFGGGASTGGSFGGSQPAQSTPNFGRDESPFGNSNQIELNTHHPISIKLFKLISRSIPFHESPRWSHFMKLKRVCCFTQAKPFFFCHPSAFPR